MAEHPGRITEPRALYEVLEHIEGYLKNPIGLRGEVPYLSLDGQLWHVRVSVARTPPPPCGDCDCDICRG